MAIKIETDSSGYVKYVNQPETDKTMAKNQVEFTPDDKDTLTEIKETLTEIETDAELTNSTMELFGNEVTIYKKNGIVQVDYFAASKIALTGSADVLVGTLPEGYRPLVRVCHDLFNSSSAKIQITFNTDGTVKVYNFGSTLAANSGWIRDFFQFFAA